MRLRNIPGAKETIAESDYCINEPEKCRGHWNEIFNNENPIHIEIGMGKGRFIMEQASSNYDVNYIGIEMYSSVLLRALQKMEENPIPNLIFICMDAMQLEDVFAPGEVERIYLNFSDPWPKDRHAKRRLTSDRFLPKYDAILAPDGRVEFKTDNKDLFDFSVEEIKNAGWHIDACTYDLHHDVDLVAGNVMTEYEERFSSKGNKICKLIFSR
jgi:tRNA (guanine-N7-)-methyltransferase